MNNIESTDSFSKKQKKDFFIHVVRVAKADDYVSNVELEMLNRMGKKMGFSDSEIETMIRTTNKSDYVAPYDLMDRFDQLYGIVKMALADGTLDKNEMRLASSFAMKSGFRENEVPRLLVLLIGGIRQGKYEDELFKKYKREFNS